MNGGVKIQNRQCFFEENNLMLNLTAQIKFLHNFNPEGLVFKTLWGFLFLIGHFAVYVSSLLIKILLMCITLEVIAVDPF